MLQRKTSPLFQILLIIVSFSRERANTHTQTQYPASKPLPKRPIALPSVHPTPSIPISRPSLVAFAIFQLAHATSYVPFLIPSTPMTARKISAVTAKARSAIGVIARRDVMLICTPMFVNNVIEKYDGADESGVSCGVLGVSLMSKSSPSSSSPSASESSFSDGYAKYIQPSVERVEKSQFTRRRFHQQARRAIVGDLV
jgi:hypothetical protein